MTATEVWWAVLGDARERHVVLLNAIERGRREGYVHREDQDRFTLGVAMTRLVLGGRLGVPPERVPLIRACAHCGGPHGAPRLEGGGPRVSVSHSGNRVALAVTEGGPVGVDVEGRAVEPGEIEGHVLDAQELAELRRLAPGERRHALLTYWVRKEAIVKATGDGLRVAPSGLRVSAPGEPPRLLAWNGRAELVDRISLYELDPGPGHVACLALIDQPGAAVREAPAGDLLG